MQDIETQYLNILRQLTRSPRQDNRTGTGAYKMPPVMLQHHMSDGFPMLTTKRVSWKTMKVELEGFIKGITSKKWFEDRGCMIWSDWCCPTKVPYGNDPETIKKMRGEDYLGECIYGASWRNFHDPYSWDSMADSDGIDQFANIIETLKKNPLDRRMICMAWNPMGLNHTALPPCHYVFQLTSNGETLDLTFNMRSWDFFLGAPFNIASYGLLLHLIAKEAGLQEGVLTAFGCDVHLYENHMDQAIEQLSRTPQPPPRITTDNFTSIFDWEHSDTDIEGYTPMSSIKAPVAV